MPVLLPYLPRAPDPRQASGRRHPLVVILALSCAAMLALWRGDWGSESRRPWVRDVGFREDRSPA